MKVKNMKTKVEQHSPITISELRSNGEMPEKSLILECGPDPEMPRAIHRVIWSKRGGFVVQRNGHKDKRLSPLRAAVEFLRIYEFGGKFSTSGETALPLLAALRG